MKPNLFWKSQGSSTVPRPLGVSIITYGLLLATFGLFLSFLPWFVRAFDNATIPFSGYALFGLTFIVTILVEGAYLLGFWRGNRSGLGYLRVGFWGAAVGSVIAFLNGNLIGLLLFVVSLPAALYLTLSRQVKEFFRGPKQ